MKVKVILYITEFHLCAQTDRQTDRQTDKTTDRQNNGQNHGWTKPLIEFHVCVSVSKICNQTDSEVGSQLPSFLSFLEKHPIDLASYSANTQILSPVVNLGSAGIITSIRINHLVSF